MTARITALLLFLLFMSSAVLSYDAHHMEILLQGKKAWNEWRVKNQQLKPDLSGADLKGKNLSGYNFNETDLSKARLTGAKLVSARFQQASLREADLSNADLRQAQFWQTNMVKTNFTRANLSRAELPSLYVKDTVFRDARMDRAVIPGQYKSYFRKQRVRGYRKIIWQDEDYGGM